MGVAGVGGAIKDPKLIYVDFKNNDIRQYNAGNTEKLRMDEVPGAHTKTRSSSRPNNLSVRYQNSKVKSPQYRHDIKTRRSSHPNNQSVRYQNPKVKSPQ
jgi:hypothetical protein